MGLTLQRRCDSEDVVTVPAVWQSNSRQNADYKVRHMFFKVSLAFEGFELVDVTRNAWWRRQMETFLRYWSFVRGIHRSPVNSPHKCQWRASLMFFYRRLNKHLGKQSWGRWFETPSHSLWRHCNGLSKSHKCRGTFSVEDNNRQ